MAAPSSSAARIGSPALVPRGAIVQATSPGTSCSPRMVSLPSKPPAAISTPRRACTVTGSERYVASTPTTRPCSVTSSLTACSVRIVPPSRSTIAASRAISDWPPLSVLRPERPARSRSTGGRTSSPTSSGSSARLMFVGWIERPNGTRPGAS